MEIDMKKLETAMIYIQRIADGNNPVNNMPAEDDSVLNNPNVIRCMYFIKDVLKEVYENNGIIGGRDRKEKKAGRAEDMFPLEVLEKFQYREDLSISNLLKQIYAPVQDLDIKKISGHKINEWLIASGYIKETYIEELKQTAKVPTEKGMAIGLRAEKREMANRTYMAIYYNKNAQEFLVRNFEKYLSGEVLE